MAGMKVDVRPLVDGTMDHYFMASLSLRGYLPRLRSGMRLKPWQEIQRALHATDDACIFLVSHYGHAVAANE
jgi:hypothetical protein